MKKQIHILQGILILTFIFIVCLLTIAFLYKINNQPLNTSYIWNIKLDNIVLKNSNKKSKTSIINNTIKTEVTLEKAGDYYEYTFDIVNKGTLSAKLSNIKYTINNPKNILVSKITYLDGTEIKQNDIIESKSTKTILIRIDYPITEEKIYEELSLSLNINFTYEAIN